tara:strand:+ start:1406 stop:2380 length:975 start_codon:yes stop_codon:yes gene_type:complete
VKNKKLNILVKKLSSLGLSDSARRVELLDAEDPMGQSNVGISPENNTATGWMSSNFGIVPEMKVGSRGESVKIIQNKLIEKGYALSNSGSGGADGVFGKNTKNAIIYFQVLNEIHPPDGIAGRRVIDKIMSGNFIGPNDTNIEAPKNEKIKYTEKDIDAISRCIFVETGFRSDYREIAGIIWVVINRSRKWNMPLWKVVDPKTGGGKNWYGKLSPNNKIRWDEAHKRHPNFNYIKSFVRNLLDGVSFENEIGNKAHFLHPGGMPRCSGSAGSTCGSRNHRICVDTGPASEGGHGKRCLPKWNIDGNTNMAGKVEVKTIGRARFS